MKTKNIITIKPKSLSPKDKEKLTKAGNIVIESETPLKIENTSTVEIVYINCASCGERIYMAEDKLNYFKVKGDSFYCTHGHAQGFSN